MRFNTGLNGTPMPSFTDSLNDEERWHLANFVVSLQKKELSKESVLQAKPIKGELPSTPDDQAWDTANSIDVQRDMERRSLACSYEKASYYRR